MIDLRGSVVTVTCRDPMSDLRFNLKLGRTNPISVQALTNLTETQLKLIRDEITYWLDKRGIS